MDRSQETDCVITLQSQDVNEVKSYIWGYDKDRYQYCKYWTHRPRIKRRERVFPLASVNRCASEASCLMFTQTWQRNDCDATAAHQTQTRVQTSRLRSCAEMIALNAAYSRQCARNLGFVRESVQLRLKETLPFRLDLLLRLLLNLHLTWLLGTDAMVLRIWRTCSAWTCSAWWRETLREYQLRLIPPHTLLISSR